MRLTQNDFLTLHNKLHNNSIKAQIASGMTSKEKSEIQCFNGHAGK